MEKLKIKVGGIYKHYKGKIIQVTKIINGKVYFIDTNIKDNKKNIESIIDRDHFFDVVLLNKNTVRRFTEYGENMQGL